MAKRRPKAFVLTIDTTTAKDQRRRVHGILEGVCDEVAAGHTSGVVMLEGHRVGAWRFIRR